MFERVFQRRQRLRPKTVAAAVPEEPGIARHAGKRHGAPVGVADADCLRQVVLELPVDLVAGRAGHRAVATHAQVEEHVEPSAAAAGTSAKRLVVSVLRGGNLFSASEAMVFFSASENSGLPQPARISPPSARDSGRKRSSKTHSTTLKSTVSEPAVAEMAKCSCHQPLMVNFTPSIR